MKSVIEEGGRLAAEIAKRPSRTSHLPKEVVRAAMAYTQRRRSSGATHVEIGRELGLSVMTVRRWLVDPVPSERPKSTKRKTRMRAVRVIDAGRSLATTIVATTRDGLRND